MSADLNHGWMPTFPFLRRFQFLWWGWRTVLHNPLFQFGRGFGGPTDIFRWTAMIGPLEIRRWSDR